MTIERQESSSGLALVTFQRVPEPKATKARVHLDLFVDHARLVLEAMIDAGATAVHTIPAGERITRVLQDPAGNEYEPLASPGDRPTTCS